MTDPYNPLEKFNLGRSIADALLLAPPRVLSDLGDLKGAGIYAIYYGGPYKPYLSIRFAAASPMDASPIYVGKAIPKGGRKGGLSGTSASLGRALRDRLGQHAKSIDECANLRLEDFLYRALVVDDIWIPLGENMLIEMFTPVWNRVLDGFGNKDPGNRRKTQYKSPWDVLHPGRKFADKLAEGGLTEKALCVRLEDFFAGRLVPLIDGDVDGEGSEEEVADER